MPVYAITGKMGSGKSLAAVRMIRDYLWKGRRVATNLDIFPEHLIGKNYRDTELYRLPDYPTVEDIKSLGMGSDIPGEEHHGLLVLDECAHWLNTRDFQNKDRLDLIKLFTMLRKLRWDVVMLIQHFDSLDKQVRNMFTEYVVYCQRLDRLSIPFVTFAFSLVGITLKLPRVHRAVVKYGAGQHALKGSTWWYTGWGYRDGFNTEQIYDADNEIGLHQVLPPYYTTGRHISDWQWHKRKAEAFARNIKPRTHHFFLVGLLAGVMGSSYAGSKTPSISLPQPQPEVTVHEGESGQQDPLDSAFITGAFRSAKFFDYYFATDKSTLDVSALGYRVNWVNECKAMLVHEETGKVRYLRCRAARPAGDEPAERAVPAPASNPQSIPKPEGVEPSLATVASLQK